MHLISELARAKINLTLRVLGKRPDGYHQIESLVGFAAVGDHVRLDTRALPGVRTGGRFARAIDGVNLAEAALQQLAKADPRLRLGQVDLEKILPVAAGIGGGAADAAGVLRAVRRANADIADEIAWAAIATRLGADVPVCLEDTPAFMRGIGDIVEPMAPLPRLDVVLVNPLVPVPADKTARVFKYLNAPPLGPERRDSVRPSIGISSRGALLDLMRRTGNDLLAPACEVMPDIVAVMSVLEKARGVEMVQISGAGPTCFGVFSAPAAASIAAEALRAMHPHWWIEPTTIG